VNVRRAPGPFDSQLRPTRSFAGCSGARIAFGISSVGAAGEDGTNDHLVRAPARRSLGMGRLTLGGVPEHAALRTMPGNLRRAFGFER
jgi:hypothetical protein